MPDNQGIVIATGNFLVREGLKGILRSSKGFKLAGECADGKLLFELLMETSPSVLIINYTEEGFDLAQIKKINRYFPETRILAITPLQQKQVVSQAISSGILSHLLTDCEKDEILEAILATSRGEKFFCGKILSESMREENGIPTESVSCNGTRISSREVQIIQLVAEGLTNKEIAERLCLSSHTIMTHRKNIMSKLGVNNTAGLVLFAIKNGIVTPNKYLFSPAIN